MESMATFLVVLLEEEFDSCVERERCEEQRD